MPEPRSAGRVRAAARRSPRKAQAPMSAAALGRRLREQGGAVSQPPASWKETELPRLLEAWGAFGGFVGHRTRAGRRRKELCLVVMTSRKHEPTRGGVRRVPAAVRWKDGRHTHALPTDVVQVVPEFKLHANELGPGDGVTVGDAKGTVGAAVVHPQAGSCVLTAGHVVLEGGGAVRGAATVSSGGVDFAAQVVDCRQSTTIDYAIIAPSPRAGCDNLYCDEYRVGPAYTPMPGDVGSRVYLLDASGNVTPLKCTGVGGRFQSSQGVYANVIQTNPGTCDGQSGGALIDDAQRVWGFLLGKLGDQFSIFAPAQLILDAAGVRFIQG